MVFSVFTKSCNATIKLWNIFGPPKGNPILISTHSPFSHTTATPTPSPRQTLISFLFIYICIYIYACLFWTFHVSVTGISHFS